MFKPELLLQELECKVSSIDISSSPDRLYAPIRYILEDGGKRMRPLLTLLAANVYDDSIDRVYDVAIGLEVFHNFTLLHDDIMDRAPLRRGRQTVHVRWSDNVAILSGDAMVIVAYRLICEGASAGKLPGVLSIFNKAALEVCEGQQLDMDFENTDRVAIEMYLEMIRLKTSVLMAAGLEIGAYICGADEQQRRAMYDFGINLGLAFQIQDDILDTYGDQSTFGKTIGGDISVGKKTFLYLTAYESANEQQRLVLRSSNDYAVVRGLYDVLDVRTTAQAAVMRYFEMAMAALCDCHSDSSRLEELISYAHSLLFRNK